jgi:hypothetical protein
VAVKLERCETPDGKARAHQEDLQRLARIVRAAAEPGGLLTLVELAVLLNRSLPTVGEYVAEHYEATGELLPLRGYRMDQGSAPTPQGQMARLWEGGLEPPDSARETSHSLTAVERYGEDYQRVRELRRRGLKVAESSPLIGRGRQVVVEYMEIVCEFHPDLPSGLD